jgi:4-hydroxy-tetrahydrodipicolinate synthase
MAALHAREGVSNVEQPRSDNSAGRPAQFGGSIVALATPFRAGAIDAEAVSHLCERQAQRGTAAIVVCGSTGEGAALSMDEQARMVVVAAEAVSGRVPVIAGCGAPATDAAVALAQSAVRAGAAALLCSPTPYVKPTQDGIIAHIRAVSRAAGRPVILYDVPGRAGVAIADETVARLFEGGLITAIKDATGDLSRPPRLRALCGAGLGQLSGDDATAAGYRAMGGHGCVSVTANIAPALCAQLQAAWDRGDLGSFARIRDLLAPLHESLFLESNPIPLKAALSVLRLCPGDLRLPLTRASLATRDRLALVLASIIPAEEEAAGKKARLILVR